MRRILVTNDDGYFSPGITALAAALRALGRVIIVAPEREASAVGHALTLRRPLRLDAMAEDVWAVDGTPTDCVNIAIHHVLEGPPDLVVSGINKGLNIGDDVTYSGTVAGALEAALLGYPSMAVSLQSGTGEWDFRAAATAAARLAEALLSRPLVSRSFLNLNVPIGEPRGVRVTTQARRNHVTNVAKRLDPRQRPYFWIDEAQDDWEPHDQSDYQAIRDGCISVTPLQPDMTDYRALADAQALAEVLRPSGTSH